MTGPNVYPAADDQRRRRAATIASIADEKPETGVEGLVDYMQALCRAATRDLALSGAAVNMMSTSGSEGVVAGSDARTARLDELQFMLGEGPCRDAFAARRPILVADLSASHRWPGYTAAASAAGVGAAFAFPLHVGSAGFGVLDLFSDKPVTLSGDQISTALIFAEAATERFMDGDAATSDGRLDAGLEAALGYRSEVYQAQGKVRVALGVSLGDALARMRADAYAHDVRLLDLANAILEGRVDLDGDGP